MKRLLLLLALTLAVLIAAGTWLLRDAYRGFDRDVTVEVARGSSSGSIAAELERAGVVRSRYLFMAARALNRTALLHAGEYSFSREASPMEVFSRIARGDVVHYDLAIPEGYNMFDIAATAEKLGLFSAADFLKAARDPSLIRDLDPKAPSLEGYLFPDTYKLTRNTTAASLCTQMTRRFRHEWRQIGSQADVHRTVTLASLVEEEAAAPADRPLISAVFHNRLKLGMKLDCDPTTVYAALLENRYRGTIYRSDLDSPHPYNTYRNPGLPPGPIANPGRESLKAALNPAGADYLFFVALPDGSGRHQFSRDLKMHEQAARRYQDAQKGKQEGSAAALPQRAKPRAN